MRLIVSELKKSNKRYNSGKLNDKDSSCTMREWFPIPKWDRSHVKAQPQIQQQQSPINRATVAPPATSKHPSGDRLRHVLLSPSLPVYVTSSSQIPRFLLQNSSCSYFVCFPSVVCPISTPFASHLSRPPWSSARRNLDPSPNIKDHQTLRRIRLPPLRIRSRIIYLHLTTSCMIEPHIATAKSLRSSPLSVPPSPNPSPVQLHISNPVYSGRLQLRQNFFHNFISRKNGPVLDHHRVSHAPRAIYLA